MSKVRLSQSEVIDIEESRFFDSVEDARNELEQLREEKELSKGVTVDYSRFDVIEEEKQDQDVVIEYREVDEKFHKTEWLRDPSTSSPYKSVADALQDLLDNLGTGGHKFRLVQDDEVLLNVSPEGMPEVPE